MKIRLEELAKSVDAELMCGSGEGEFTGVVMDTRKITSNKELFFALKGVNTDGHNYIDMAAEQGAVGAVVERTVSCSVQDFPILKVTDVKIALQKSAKLARDYFKGRVVGVTGSNGKTTTKDMIAQVLAEQFSTEKTHANFNNEIGLPLTILNCPDEKQALVLEMGMRARGEIEFLANIARPDVGVITNIGVAHMELLKTQENIAYAKFELINALPQEGTAILNADDEWCLRLAPSTCKTIFYGFSTNADVRCVDMKLSSTGTDFKLYYNNKEYDAFLPTWGKHNILNALAAVAAGISLGMEPSRAIAGLRRYVASPMRLEIKKGKSGCCIVDDAYNANPLSVAASLEVLRDIANSRTIAVLGEMYELGDMEAEGHMTVGKEVAKNDISVLVTVGKKAEIIAQGAILNGMDPNKIHTFSDNEKASQFLLEIVESKDTILVKGSRGMRMESIVAALI